MPLDVSGTCPRRPWTHQYQHQPLEMEGRGQTRRTLQLARENNLDAVVGQLHSQCIRDREGLDQVTDGTAVSVVNAEGRRKVIDGPDEQLDFAHSRPTDRPTDRQIGLLNSFALTASAIPLSLITFRHFRKFGVDFTREGGRGQTLSSP